MKLKDGFVLRTLGTNHLVVPVGVQTVDFRCIITLNDTGAFLWQQLQQEREPEELVRALLAEYDVTPAQAQIDVAAFTDKLREAGLFA